MRHYIKTDDYATKPATETQKYEAFSIKIMAYEGFLEANPTLQSRIEALTSGILTPDTKAATLLAMDPERLYTKGRLYERVRGFGGIDSEVFPITSGSVWPYCDGGRDGGQKRAGSLEIIGAVLRTHVVPADTPIGQKDTVAYQKTDAGSDFGDPAAALGIWFVNELARRGKPAPRSLLRIFGAPSKKRDAEYRRGYAVYRIMEHLALNPETDFRREDIVRQACLNEIPTSHALNALGLAGMIHYVSPHRDRDGRPASGWSVYIADTRLDYGICLADLRETLRWRITPRYLRAVIDYLNENMGKEVDRNEISKELGIDRGNAGSVLSSLAKTGYLVAEFGDDTSSHARANGFTTLIWNTLLEPIGRVAHTMDPEVPGFAERLSEYRRNSGLLKAHLETLYGIYAEERTNRGIEGGRETRRDLVAVLRSAEEPMKLSHIIQEVNATREAKELLPVSRVGIINHLKKLTRGDGAVVERVGKGMYAAKVK